MGWIYLMRITQRFLEMNSACLLAITIKNDGAGCHEVLRRSSLCQTAIHAVIIIPARSLWLLHAVRCGNIKSKVL